MGLLRDAEFAWRGNTPMNKLFLSEIIKKTFLRMAILFSLLGGSAMAEGKMCADLKKVNNLDEMLYQFYVNLDSDCLFTMPMSELEKAWGIKIMSLERLQPGQTVTELRDSVDFRGKPYHSEADAFYIQASRFENRTKSFVIYITEAYYQAHATLFPEGNYPRLLPEPIKKRLDRPPHGYISPDDEPLPFPKTPGVYNRYYFYYWLNSDKTNIIRLIPGPANSLYSISVIGKITSDFY